MELPSLFCTSGDPADCWAYLFRPKHLWLLQVRRCGEVALGQGGLAPADERPQTFVAGRRVGQGRRWSGRIGRSRRTRRQWDRRRKTGIARHWRICGRGRTDDDVVFVFFLFDRQPSQRQNDLRGRRDDDAGLGRRSGCRCSALMFTAGRQVTGATLRTGRIELALEIQQLSHEVEIGRNVGLAPPHEIVGVVQRHGQLVHQVGHRDGHRTRYSGQTVD